MKLEHNKSHLLQASFFALMLSIPMAAIAEVEELVVEEDVAVAEEPTQESVTKQQEQAEKRSKSGDVWAGFGSQTAVNLVARASNILDNVDDKEVYKKAQELAKQKATEAAIALQEEAIKNLPTNQGGSSSGGYFDKGVNPTRSNDIQNSGSAKDRLATIFGANSSDSAEDAVYFAQQCPSNFYLGVAPKITDADSKMGEFSYNLCLNGFAVKYSGVSKTPLWSAEYLTARRLAQASKLERADSFHVEERIPSVHSATLLDYKNSGYDRGHLAPNADMANTQQQYDSFSLVNIAPQRPALNRSLWREVESDVRGFVYENNEAYVVTGTAFTNARIKQLNKSVLVPSAIYKAVFIPSRDEAAVYYAPNDDSLKLEVISLKELESRIGFDVFPGVSEEVKAKAADLPKPDSSSFNPSAFDDNSSASKVDKGRDKAETLLQMIIEFFKNLLRFF